MTPASRLSALLLLTLGSLGWSATPARAQPFTYALNERGKLVVDAVVLDELKSKFKPTSATAAEERWFSLAVRGSDRYALRVDGLLFKNGSKLANLPTQFPFFAWEALAVDEEDRVFALSGDGRLARDGEILSTLDRGDFAFLALATDGNDAWTLRSDGAVVFNTDAAPSFQFEGGPTFLAGIPDLCLFLPDLCSALGVTDEKQLEELTDGESLDTNWLSIAVDPVTGDVYALRLDGILYRGTPVKGGLTGDPGTKVAELPKPSLAYVGNPAGTGELYTDLGFLSDGTWVVLRGNGEVYTSGDPLAPAYDFPGDPLEDGDQDELYFDMDIHDDTVYGLRFDGKIFRDTEPGELHFQYPKSRYRAIALSDDIPDLTNIKNRKPVVAKTKVAALENDALMIPVLYSDADKDEDELTLTFTTPLPAGMTYDAETRMLTWPSANLVGNVKIKLEVDDGDAKPSKGTVSIKVKALDTSEKNKKPKLAKVKNAQALVGRPFSMRVMASDPDGDGLTFVEDTDSGPFDLEVTDAAFDRGSGVFTWTPTFDDIGKHVLLVRISDGFKTVKSKTKISVVNGLIFDEVDA